MNSHRNRVTNRTHWAWLVPILALSPLALAAKGCDNAGVVGNNCPTPDDCPSGTAGKGGSEPEPDQVCGAFIAEPCFDGKGYCDFPKGAECGIGDQTGICKPKPEECDLIYSPVCGCDGKTYANECAAQMAGLSVASSGECGSSSGGGVGETCGGVAALDCEKGLYCHFPVETQCASGDQTGTCTPIGGGGCTKELNEVCGCDNRTYGNPCMATAAGVSIAHQGACKPTTVACGEIGDCAEDEFCNFPPEANCGLADGPGVCTKVPSKDTACDANYAPVCGCDGKTYGNECTALVAGVSVASEGECGTLPVGDCGGLTGLACKTGFFCDYPANMACGAADGLGTCTVVPNACPQNIDPVCGCDGEDHANPCEANGKGTDVAYKGACKK
jgi:hypothetical protein